MVLLLSPRGPATCRRARSASAGAGTWTASPRALRDATITARVGKAVHLVLASERDRPRRVHVELDGRPSARDAGEDVRGGAVTVRAQRLYRLVKLAEPGEHVLCLRFDRGVSGFAFTFGWAGNARTTMQPHGGKRSPLVAALLSVLVARPRGPGALRGDPQDRPGDG